MGEEDNHTKDLLNESNFKIWKQQIYLLLKRKNLIEYIYSEKLTKVLEKDVSDDDKNDLQLVDGKTNVYYAKGTKRSTIENDVKAKGYLNNNIENDIAINIDFISSTTYEIYNLIKGMNECSDEDRISELKKSLDSSRYDIDGDTPLSIFISNMNMKFSELENLKFSIDDKKKFDYLYNALPEELVIKSNLINYKKKTWEEITKYIIETSQLLKRLKEKKERYNEIVSNNVNVNTSNKIKNNNKINYNKVNDYNKNRNSSYNKKNSDYNKVINNYNSNRNSNNRNYKNIRNIQCWNCGKYGHYSEDCRNSNNRNSNSNNNNYRYKNKYVKNCVLNNKNY